MRIITKASIALALAALPLAAGAATYRLQYTTFADSLFPAVSVDARLITDNGEFYGAPGNLLVLGITGTRDGVAIDGLTDPFSEIFTTGDIVDGFGITFSAGGYDFNFARLNPAFYQEFGTPSGGGLTEGRLVFDAALTAVPEPGSWLLMIGGFGIAGTALRRRRTLRPA